jgi:hypothetical protein
MRMAIGLAAILGDHRRDRLDHVGDHAPAAQQAINVKKKVEPQVQQVAGSDTSGRDARDSIKLDSETSGGKMTSVLVTAIDDGGAMAKYFGLKRGDSIVEIAPQGEASSRCATWNRPPPPRTCCSALSELAHIVVVAARAEADLPATEGAPVGFLTQSVFTLFVSFSSFFHLKPDPHP